jgi:hypothetical protein
MAMRLIHITITALYNNGRRDRNVYRISVGKSYRMTLLIYRNGEGIVTQWIGEMGCAFLSLHSSDSGLNPGAGFCAQGNGLLGSKKQRKFID